MIGIETHPGDGGGLATCRVALASGVALVDLVDLPLVSAHEWFLAPSEGKLYAQTRPPIIRMHRLILNAPKGTDVDHVNGDGLDNRRSNLRLATRPQNMANNGLTTANRSGYKGVAWKAEHGKWAANIRVEGRQRFLGYFDDPWEAAQAYNVAAVGAWGDFAYQNVRVSG